MSSAGDDDTPIRRLAGKVKARRLQLGLSVRQAAETADIARNTWTALEDGSKKTAETSYAAVERTLRWAAGSINTIKAGGEPREIATPEPAPLPDNAAQIPASDADAAIIRIMRSDEITDEQKARIIRVLIAEQEESRRRFMDMAERLIAESQN